jgi:hypothetical protein
MWAHTITEGHAIQTSPGVWNEEILQGMDFILAQARKRGLKIIWALADNWYPVGGVGQGLFPFPGLPPPPGRAPFPWSPSPPLVVCPPFELHKLISRRNTHCVNTSGRD